MTQAHTPVPPAECDIDPDLVGALLTEQFPKLAHLAITTASHGWDNVVFRLGETLAARLPRRQIGADISATELDWLPRIGSGWSFPAPVPLYVGIPGAGYPWRWSIVPWLEGDPVIDAPLGTAGAAEIGAALAQVHREAPQGAPRNPFRSAPLADRIGRLIDRLEVLRTHKAWSLDSGRVVRDVTRAAEGGLRIETWCHLDIHGRNTLSTDGRLAGIIDWGDAGVADAHTDLGQARYLLGRDGFEQAAIAYVAGGGMAEPDSQLVEAEAAVFAVTMACVDDAKFLRSGWLSLVDLGYAQPAR